MRFVAWFALCTIAAALAGGKQPKNYKDREEYDAYNEVTKDFAAKNFSKALADLERWSEKYSDSEFKDDRQMLYVQAYAGTNQMGKVLDSTAVVLANDRFTSANSANVLRVLYAAMSAIRHIPDPSPQQLAVAAKAASLLETYDTAPDGVTATAWATTRSERQAAARAALLYIALIPASRAVKANDCGGAETAAMKAIQEFPESVQAAWLLALANLCLAKTDEQKTSPALYELARAAALEPVKGMVDAKWQQTSIIPYAEKAYSQFHGADPQGFKDLKELAVQSALPPPGFAIKSASEIARENQDEFESKYPQLALWLKIKNALSGSDGERYFESDLKGAAVPELQGVLVEALPECRPTELRVAIRLPNNTQNPPAEIALKLQRPLKGKPELGSEIHWTGVASAFSKEPLLLIMDVEPSNVKNLTFSPCELRPRSPSRAVSK